MFNYKIFTDITIQTLQNLGFEKLSLSEEKDNTTLFIEFDSVTQVNLHVHESCISMILDFPQNSLDIIFKKMFKKNRLNKKQIDDLAKEMTNILAGKLLESISDPNIVAHIFFPQSYYKNASGFQKPEICENFKCFIFSSQGKTTLKINLCSSPFPCL